MNDYAGNKLRRDLKVKDLKSDYDRFGRIVFVYPEVFVVLWEDTNGIEETRSDSTSVVMSEKAFR